MKYQLVFLKSQYDEEGSDRFLSVIKLLNEYSVGFKAISYVDSIDDIIDNVDYDEHYLVVADNQKFNLTYKYLNDIFEHEECLFNVYGAAVHLLKISDKIYEDVKELVTAEGYKVFKLYGAVSINKIQSYFKEKSIRTEITRNGLDVRVKLSNYDLKKAGEMKNVIISDFVTMYKDIIYADEDCSLIQMLSKLCIVRNVKISCAESFTGGALSSAITSVPGSSAYFYEGCVTYSEDAKKDRLDVREDTLITCKPVSAMTAHEMCRGLLNNEKVDAVVSTTGLAGPSSDSSGFNVGLCFIAVGTRKNIINYKYNFSGFREEIIEKGVSTAIFHLIKTIKEM